MNFLNKKFPIKRRLIVQEFKEKTTLDKNKSRDHCSKGITESNYIG